MLELLPASRFAWLRRLAAEREEEEGKGCFACMHDALCCCCSSSSLSSSCPAWMRAWWKVLCLYSACFPSSRSHPTTRPGIGRIHKHNHDRKPARETRAVHGGKRPSWLLPTIKSNPSLLYYPHTQATASPPAPSQQWCDNFSSWPCCQQSPRPLWVSKDGREGGREQ